MLSFPHDSPLIVEIILADSKGSEQKEEHLRTKVKTASEEERTLTWKEHFKNLLGDYRQVADKPITKIINCQRDIKLE